MSLSALAQTIIVEEPCEFEYRDGLVYVRYESVGIAFAFRTQTFFRNFASAARCMQDCHSRQGAEIIEFPTEARA